MIYFEIQDMAKSKKQGKSKKRAKRGYPSNRFLVWTKVVFVALLLFIFFGSLFIIRGQRLRSFSRISHNMPLNIIASKSADIITPFPTPTPTPTPKEVPLTGFCLRVPVLMYHHIQPEDVAKTLGQASLTVDNGIFDQQTENAVRAFQSKYMSDVMGPWGATQSSGYVYITTLKKVNEIACNTSLTLSPSELAIVNAYKDQQNQNSNVTGTPGSINASTTLNSEIGQNGTSSNAITAAAGSFADAWNNFWGSIWSHLVKAF